MKQNSLDSLPTIDVTGFDIDSIESIDSAEVQLKHKGALIPLFVTFASPEHPNRKAIVHSKQRRLRQQFAKTGKMEFNDPSEDEQDENELLAACVLDWRGFISGGKELPFSKPVLTDLLSDSKRAWLRASIKAAFDETEVFTVASVKV